MTSSRVLALADLSATVTSDKDGWWTLVLASAEESVTEEFEAPYLLVAVLDAAAALTGPLSARVEAAIEAVYAADEAGERVGSGWSARLAA